MSDSDEDFLSADEGEGAVSAGTLPNDVENVDKKVETQEKTSKMKDKKVAAAEAISESKGNSSQSSSAGDSKTKSKKQKNKNKGKRGTEKKEDIAKGDAVLPGVEEKDVSALTSKGKSEKLREKGPESSKETADVTILESSDSQLVADSVNMTQSSTVSETKSQSDDTSEMSHTGVEVTEHDATAGKVLEQSADNIEEDNQTADVIDENSQSAGNDEGGQSSETLMEKRQSTDNLDEKEQSTDKLDEKEQSTDKLDEKEQSTDNLDEKEQSTDKLDEKEQSTDKLDEKVQLADKVSAVTSNETGEIVSKSADQSAANSSAADVTSHQHDKEQSILEKLALAGEKKQQSSGWGSWGSWGSSLLSTATSSIQTFTGQVSEGMHTVVETFEASVGAPPPHQLDEDLSKFVKEPDEGEQVIHKDQGAQLSNPDPPTDGATNEGGDDSSKEVNKEANSDWFSSWGVSGITDQLQSKTKVILGSGLDVLETIGKKTMEQIKESDPGFAKTKGFLKGHKTNLSQMLREAKAESEKRTAEESNAQPLVVYSTLFDQHHGLASLEALELLSVTCVNSLTHSDDLEGDLGDDLQTTFDSLAEKFSQIYDSDEECEDEHDFPAGIENFTQKLSLPVKHARLTEVQQKARSWLTDCQQRQDTGERIEGHVIHNEALNSFAEISSATIELCHKSGELLLLPSAQESGIDIDAVSDSFISILRLVTNEISIQSRLYNDCLNTAADDSEDPDSINPMITNIFLEASNSSSYVRDAFKLLLPVMKKCIMAAT